MALVLPNDAADEEIAALSDRYEVARGLQPTAGRWEGDRIVPLDPRSKCFCGTTLGTIGPPPEHVSEAFIEARTRSLRKKGWGEAKIARWVEELHRRERRDDARHALDASAGPNRFNAEAWLPFLQAVVAEGHARRVGIVMYEPEDWGRFRRGSAVSSDDFDAGHLDSMVEGDVLTVS